MYTRQGKIQFYAITAELYEVGSDDLATGVAEIDAIEELFDSAIALSMGSWWHRRLYYW